MTTPARIQRPRLWILWWQGSGPQKGDHIMEMDEHDLGYEGEVAWIGQVHHDEADIIIREHNLVVERLRAALANEPRP